jgi:NAD(P)-dependent dehydrogenase (short-subunit alcohol dehydrogenase family)
MKIIAITGITGAIGKAAALELAKDGHLLILIGRNPEKLKIVESEIRSAGNANVETYIVDFTNLLSVKKAADKIKNTHTKLDGLVNVASVYKAKREITKDGFESMFGTNHMGTFVLTQSLLPLLEATPGSRIITVSAPSTTKLNFEDLQSEKKFNSFAAFGASKMANLLFAFSLAKKLNGINTASMAFFPGLTKSGLTREMPFLIRFIVRLLSGKPEKPGKAIAQLMTSTKFNDVNGKFYNSKFKELKKPGYSGDTIVQDKLWKASEELAKVIELSDATVKR